jgi:MFS family permease
MFSLPVFLRFISRDSGWSITGLSSAMTFGFLATALGSIIWGNVLARKNFPLRMMGAIIGGTAMAGSLGMATGPLAGGLIYDSFASYGWLYIGACGIGIGAFLIALTFKPYGAQPTREPARAAA